MHPTPARARVACAFANAVLHTTPNLARRSVLTRTCLERIRLASRATLRVILGRATTFVATLTVVD